MRSFNYNFSSLFTELGKQHQILAILNDVAVLLPVFLVIFTWRGFVKAALAKMMGDNTAQKDGFLTLNPLAHIDLVGMLIIVAVFFVVGSMFYNTLPRAVLLMLLVILGVRWTIPVPFDESKLKHYRLGGTITMLAGPISNIILAFLAAGAIKISLYLSLPHYAIISLIEIFQTMIDISLFFGILNFMPLPPFDGGLALRYALPYSMQYIVNWLEEYSLFIFFILVFAPGISTIFLGTVFSMSVLCKQIIFKLFF